MCKMRLSVLMFLIFCTYFDLRYKKIPLSGLLAFGIVMIIIDGANGSLIQRTEAIRLIPGAVFMLLAFLSRQAVGYGDGMMILFLGISMDICRCIQVVFIGLVLCSAISVFILLLKKGSRQTKLPFAPFLLAAWGIMLIGL